MARLIHMQLVAFVYYMPSHVVMGTSGWFCIPDLKTSLKSVACDSAMRTIGFVRFKTCVRLKTRFKINKTFLCNKSHSINRGDQQNNLVVHLLLLYQLKNLVNKR